MAMSSLAIRSLNLTKAAASKSGALKTVNDISILLRFIIHFFVVVDPLAYQMLCSNLW